MANKLPVTIGHFVTNAARDAVSGAARERWVCQAPPLEDAVQLGEICPPFARPNMVDIAHFTLIKLQGAQALIGDERAKSFKIGFEFRSVVTFITRVGSRGIMVPAPIAHETIALHLYQLRIVFADHP